MNDDQRIRKDSLTYTLNASPPLWSMLMLMESNFREAFTSSSLTEISPVEDDSRKIHSSRMGNGVELRRTCGGDESSVVSEMEGEHLSTVGNPYFVSFVLEKETKKLWLETFSCFSTNSNQTCLPEYTIPLSFDLFPVLLLTLPNDPTS